MSERIIGTIKRIEKARAALRQAIEDNEAAIQPVMKDLDMIPRIHDIFMETKKGCLTSSDRKEFTFIVIYLYAPHRFFGGKIPKGLRDRIGRTLNVNSKSVISNFCADLLVLYSHYSDFRGNVDLVLEMVTERLVRK